MELESIYREIEEFCKSTHGSSNYDVEHFFIQGRGNKEFAPLKYLGKKFEGLKHPNQYLPMGFVQNSFDLSASDDFAAWYEKQFAKKLIRKVGKDVTILYRPNELSILKVVEEVDRCYQVLRENQVILNGKNLPTQLGEWYAKCIFGLRQVKSASQRGFDFELEGKRVEVKVHWSDMSSPKGVKIRKSLVELSDHCVVVYMAKNFMIREVCFLDSEFVIRKFSDKGHTIFLKDVDIAPYFFSKSVHHMDKVVNPNALMRFASPTFALKMSERFPNA